MSKQVNLWQRTKNILGHLTERMEQNSGRPKNQNEVVDMALHELCLQNGFSEEDIRRLENIECPARRKKHG